MAIKITKAQKLGSSVIIIKNLFHFRFCLRKSFPQIPFFNLQMSKHAVCYFREPVETPVRLSLISTQAALKSESNTPTLHMCT